METLAGILRETQVHSMVDYISLAREIEKKFTTEANTQSKKIRMAFLSNFTLSGIKEALFVKCLKEGISSEFYFGPYDQYSQEILDTKSRLYDFDPDLVILLLDATGMNRDRYALQNFNADELHAWANSSVSTIASLVSNLEANSPKSKVLVHNLEVPIYSPLGIIENRQSFSLRDAVEVVNSGLRSAFRNDPRAFLFDYDLFASKVGKENSIDYKLYYLGDIRISPRVIPSLCEEYMPYIRAMLSMTRKCLVLDLDGVLWGGVIGEDGIEGIKLGPSSEGQPFLDLQRYILSLYNRGVILAINSTNNPEDALEVFRSHPHMILKEEHFAAMQINWDNKVANMKAIAEQIEIGIDSLVFVDDNPMNREVVRLALPEILTIDLPEDIALYPRTIANLRAFDSLQLTSEDRVRGKMYAEQRKRQEFQKSTSDITEYLKALKTVVTIESASKFNIPRISQLTQKTNQFNVTTRRYLEGDILRMSESGNYLIASVKVEDKFGDSGITGVAIVEKGKEKWRIDTFLLSCRVLGRKVEESLLSHIIERATQEGASTIVGEFIPTKKNLPAKDFFSTHDFKKVTSKGVSEVWEYDLNRKNEFPQYVKVIVR